MRLFLQAVIEQDADRRGATRRQLWEEYQEAKRRRQQPAPALPSPHLATPPARPRPAAGPRQGAAARPASPAAMAAAAGAGADRVERLLHLRCFAGRCLALFPGMELPPEVVQCAQADTLAALLASELGPAVVGDLQARAQQLGHHACARLPARLLQCLPAGLPFGSREAPPTLPTSCALATPAPAGRARRVAALG